MKHRATTVTKNLFQLSALSLALVLAGCGGGDSGGDTLQPEPCLGTGCNDNGGGAGGNSGGNAGGVVTPVETIKVSDIVLYANDTPTRTVNKNGATAVVMVTDSEGKAIPNALVSFSGEGLTFGSSNASVVTNGEGKASMYVRPASATDTGTYAMTATATYDGKSATTGSYYYSLQALNVELSELTVADNELEPGETTLVTVRTKDLNTADYANDVTVNFNTNCGSFDNISGVSTNKGNVSATYSTIDSNGKLCTGKQTITVTTPNGSADAISTEVTIAKIKPTSIVYSTEEGLTLGTRKSGSASTSQIEFTVFSNGTPASNQPVLIEPLRTPGDFSFIRNGNRDADILTSDASGKVTVTVYPGDLAGPVELKASLLTEPEPNTPQSEYVLDSQLVLADPEVFALSKRLAVATGRPTQDGITLAVGSQVLLNNATVSTTITARLTDRLGNYVPKGTAVSFISEGGTVTPTCSTNDEGACTVTFTSQNPRPEFGRVSVIAFIEGDKKFIDTDGDNVYTPGVDTLPDNIGMMYRDDNENMQYDSDIGEYLYRTNKIIANPIACASPKFTQPSRQDTCDTSLDAILRRQVIMGFADSVPTIVNRKYDGIITFDMYGNGSFTLPMPSATTVEINSEDRTDNNMDCVGELVSGVETVPGPIDLKRVYRDNGVLQNGFLNNPIVKYSVGVGGCTSGDKVELVVTSPGAVYKERLEGLIP